MPTAMPDDLKADAGSGKPIDPRPITLEDSVGRQIDRIAYLRSVGAPWAEAVFMFRDLVVGLEDDEFWDGVPASVRSKLKGASEDEKAQVEAEWAPYGWRGKPMRRLGTPENPGPWKPTAENLSNALRIVMRLLARRGIAWRTRRPSDLGPRFNQGVVEGGQDGSRNGSDGEA